MTTTAQSRVHLALAGVAIVLGAGAGLIDVSPKLTPGALAQDIQAERDHITAPELAAQLMNGESHLKIYDLRSEAEYQEFHIPSAQRIPIDGLMNLQLPRNTSIVVYSEGGSHAAQAWVLLRLQGYQNAFFLREGIYEWVARVDQPRLAIDATAAERAEFARAAQLSRFFGGNPVADVPRSDVPTGYWTESGYGERDVVTQPTALRKLRRRGC